MFVPSMIARMTAEIGSHQLRRAQATIQPASIVLTDRLGAEGPAAPLLGRPRRWLRALWPGAQRARTLGDSQGGTQFCAPDVFRLAQIYFDVHRRVLPVHLPGPPGILHWTAFHEGIGSELGRFLSRIGLRRVEEAPVSPETAFAVSQTSGDVRLRWDPFILDAPAALRTVATGQLAFTDAGSIYRASNFLKNGAGQDTTTLRVRRQDPGATTGLHAEGPWVGVDRLCEEHHFLGRSGVEYLAPE